MLKPKAAILMAITAGIISAILIQTDARSLAWRALPMAAKSQERLPQSQSELVKAKVTTVSVVVDHDAAKRLTVLTKGQQ